MIGEVKFINLRIHHFYDIIRDFGREQRIEPHPYGHSYHRIARIIWENPNLKMKFILGCDAVCEGCIKKEADSCHDVVEHRKDFRSKQMFNDFIDQRIMKVCKVRKEKLFTPIDLSRKANFYLENISWIYEGNDLDHTRARKKNVKLGLKNYSKKHKFDIAFAES